MFYVLCFAVALKSVDTLALRQAHSETEQAIHLEFFAF